MYPMSSKITVQNSSGRWESLMPFLRIHSPRESAHTQTSIASHLPGEILAIIFLNLIAQESLADCFEKFCFEEKSDSVILYTMARVCKRWSQSALPLMYEHAHLSSEKALQTFLNTIRYGSIIKIERVMTVSYRPSLKRNGTHRCPDSYLAGCQIILMMRDIIPSLQRTMFNLMLSQANVHMFMLHEIPGRIDHLFSLHLKPHDQAPPYDLCIRAPLPNLRLLTLELYRLASDSVWPETPNLECLRLIHVWIREDASENTWLRTPRRLKRLELMNVYNEGDFVARLIDAQPRGCGLRDSLEDFTIYPLGLAGIRNPNFQLIKSLSRLKSLCVGAEIFSKSACPSTYLPTSLERLSVIEPENFDDVDYSMELEDNKAGLIKFLENKRYEKFAQLRKIRLRGLKEDWEDVTEKARGNGPLPIRNLVKDFAEVGLCLEMKLIERGFTHVAPERIMKTLSKVRRIGSYFLRER